MRLYHGTSERWLERIMRQGLRPRGDTAGNWDAYPSRPDMVYLTSTYPLYFGAVSAVADERVLILEMELEDLDEMRLFPDEDVVAQSIQHGLSRDSRLPLADIQRHVVENLEVYQEHWRHGLDAMGTVAHLGPIPPERIKAAALIDLTARPNSWLFSSMVDPQISVLNYKVKGAWYQELVAWVMGHRSDIPESIAGLNLLDPEFAEKRREHLERESADRSGIALYKEEIWLKRVNGFK